MKSLNTNQPTKVLKYTYTKIEKASWKACLVCGQINKKKLFRVYLTRTQV